ncbi:MAG: hypothetical protein KF723_04790 [Rhizobiaceae bacterium]|nr:hypothetical protein [Rhizobiaceae bacterium]
MTKLETIEESISALPDKELWTLSEWLEELKAARWDKQIEEDAKAGKLDKLFAQAKADIAAGRVKPL